jgi:hypothetical protein
MRADVARSEINHHRKGQPPTVFWQAMNLETKVVNGAVEQ